MAKVLVELKNGDIAINEATKELEAITEEGEVLLTAFESAEELAVAAEIVGGVVIVCG